MKRGFGFFLSILILVLAVGFVSAAPSFLAPIGDNDVDHFYYDGSIVFFNVTVDWGTDNAGNVSVNCSVFGDSEAKLAINTTGLIGATNYTANCTINYSAIPDTLVKGNSFTQITGGNITFSARNASGFANTSTLTGAIVAYNMTIPPALQDNCIRLGSATTNFSNVNDFGKVNFVINIQANFSCLNEGRVNAPTFRDVMILNLTSVNISNHESAQKLQQLNSAMNVSLIAPHKHGNARIYINTSFFDYLDTDATIKFFYLPFTRLPSVDADNLNNLNSSATSWSYNGFDSTLNITTINLTIGVFGFSGYNITDSQKPVINIISPITHIKNGTNIVVNVTINGTGTEPSYIEIYNSSYYYNGTSGENTAGCENISSDKETFRCIFLINLSEGVYNFNVDAWDFGGNYPGNNATNTSSFVVDGKYPEITLISPGDGDTWGSSTSVRFKFNVSDVAIANCSLIIDDVVKDTKTDMDINDEITFTKTLGNGDYEWYISCTDYTGMTNSSEKRDLTVNYEEGSESSGDGGAEEELSFWTNTFSPSDAEFKAGFNKQLGKGERVKIKLGNETHYVGVIKVNSDKVTVNVSSNPQQATLMVGEEKKFEVTDDNYYDLSVKLNSINNTKANLTITYLHEQIATTSRTNMTNTTTNQTAPKNQTGLGQEEQKAGISKIKLIIMIIVVILIITTGVAYYYKENIKEYFERIRIRMLNNAHKYP